MVLLELGNQISAAIQKASGRGALDDEAVDQMLSEISRALLMADVNVKLVKDFRTAVKTKLSLEDSAVGKKRVVQNAVFNQLLKLLDPGIKPFAPVKGKPNVVMTVGLQGSGKTTTCTKYALWYQKKGWKVGLVCADTFRAGAYDQLKQNAAKSRVPFYGSLTETDPVVIAREGVEKFKSDGYDLIIVDTSGRHKQEDSLFEEMAQISEVSSPDDIIFVMDSTIGQAAADQAKAFKSKVKVGSVIITKLDGHAKGGGALSAVAATGSPIIFVGTGEHFDDFKRFEPKSFLQQMMGMGDIEGLLGALQDAGIDHNSSIYQMEKGQTFTMRVMYEHLSNIMKLGPMGKIMDMMPGMSGLLPKGAEAEQGNKLKTFTVLIDSMCDKELDHPHPKKIMTPDRLDRIARGAGKPVQEMQDLLKAYVKFEELVKKMGGMNLMDMLKNPGGAGGRGGHANLSKMMNPQAMKAMGGQAGLQNMMKGLGGKGGGGMPDMSAVMKMAQQLAGGKGGGGGLGDLASMMGGLGGLGGGGGSKGDMAKMMKAMGGGRR